MFAYLYVGHIQCFVVLNKYYIININKYLTRMSFLFPSFKLHGWRIVNQLTSGKKSRKVTVLMQYDSALPWYYTAAELLTDDKISERTDHAALPPFPVTKPWMSVSTKWCSVHFGCFALHPLVLLRLLVYEITDVLSASSRPERVEVLLGSCITTAMRQLGGGARKSASGCVYREFTHSNYRLL